MYTLDEDGVDIVITTSMWQAGVVPAKQPMSAYVSEQTSPPPSLSSLLPESKPLHCPYTFVVSVVNRQLCPWLLQMKKVQGCLEEERKKPFESVRAWAEKHDKKLLRYGGALQLSPSIRIRPQF